MGQAAAKASSQKRSGSSGSSNNSNSSDSTVPVSASGGKSAWGKFTGASAGGSAPAVNKINTNTNSHSTWNPRNSSSGDICSGFADSEHIPANKKKNDVFLFKPSSATAAIDEKAGSKTTEFPNNVSNTTATAVNTLNTTITSKKKNKNKIVLMSNAR